MKNFIYTTYIILLSFTLSACSLNQLKQTKKKLNGEHTTYDSNGHKLMTTNFKDGLQEGIQKAYYPNGKVMIEYNYINGQREGLATSYKLDGTVQSTVLYKSGQIIKKIK